MAQGFQAFDAAGNLLVDVSTRITKVIGSTTIVADSTGSLSVPNANTGLIWYALYFPVGSRYNPVIVVNNSTGVISWSPNTAYPQTHTDVQMIYGVY